MIVRVDALQVVANELAAADAPGCQLAANLVDGRFLQVELERCLRTNGRGDENERRREQLRHIAVVSSSRF
ncbi:MAG TPA: hypothetical protein VGJ78_02700 [Vicinamibacterales bacterium]